MGTVPSSTGATGSDGPRPPLACVLHPTRRAIMDSTPQLSFKAWARNQILRLQRQLLDEREKHERVVKELKEQNDWLAVSLSSRVEHSEAQWSRLQKRASDLWLEVKGLELAEHIYPETNALAQIASTSITNTSTQTQETSFSNAATQTDEDTRSILKLRLAAANENELKRWRTAFSHLSGTPEQMALSSKATNEELREWRTGFKEIPGSPAQKAASSKEAIDEVKMWRTSFKHPLGTPAQAATKSEEAINELREWHTSFKHVSGTPAQRAEASRTLLSKFTLEQKKSSRLLESQNTLRRENEALTSKIRELEHDNPQQRPRLRRRRTARPDRLSPPKSHSQKRKREVSEPPGQQDEPPPAFQTRRTEHSNPGWNQRGREEIIMAPWTAPPYPFGYQDFPVLPTMPSIPPTGGPIGSWREPPPYQYYAPPGYPMVLSGPYSVPGRKSREVYEEWSG